jgi:hypothetical protein
VKSVIVDVAKGVAKELPLHTVQRVGFDAPILGQFRSVLLKEMPQEMDLHAVQFSMLGDHWVKWTPILGQPVDRLKS